jgi:hypothetical protein
MKKNLALLFLLFSGSIVLGQTTSSKAPVTEPSLKGNTAHFQTLYSRVIPADGKTFGYEILADGKLFIRQLTIPGQPGSLGFQTKNDAEKVAILAIEKIKKGIMPPTISLKELQQLKIIL